MAAVVSSQANPGRVEDRHCRRQQPTRDCRTQRAARAGSGPIWAAPAPDRKDRVAGALCAVEGMNCAMPWACSPLRVSGPTTFGLSRLSCHMRRAKNSTGKPLSAAADWMIGQRNELCEPSHRPPLHRRPDSARARACSRTQVTTAESSPAPEKFFAKTPSTERLPPFWGRNRFSTGFWERGHD